MEELLQKLLEADVLSAETKKELEEAFKSQLDEAIAVAKKDAAADVRSELTEQWITERNTLIEAIDTKVGEYLEGELEELKEDIEKFRDLEAEHAVKLVEEKAAMSSELKSDLKDLVEKIDAFLEIRLASEMEELYEDIAEIRKNEFGRKIYETFAAEFMRGYADTDSAKITVSEMEKRLQDMEKVLEESESKRATLERKVKMEQVLAPLAGRQKEVMEAILRNINTENLDEGYKTFIGRVLHEAKTTAKSEKEDKVLAESEEKKSGKKPVTEGVIVTGDNVDVIKEESVQKLDESTAWKTHLQKLAGIVK